MFNEVVHTNIPRYQRSLAGCAHTLHCEMTSANTLTMLYYAQICITLKGDGYLSLRFDLGLNVPRDFESSAVTCSPIVSKATGITKVITTK